MERGRFIYGVVTVYNIIISIISIWFFGSFVLLQSEKLTLGFFIIFVLVTALFVIILLSNYLLLFSDNNRFVLLKINIWFAAAQILHFKMFGVVFDFNSGPEVLFFIIKKTGWNFGFSTEVWNSVVTVFYAKRIEGFAIYVNVVSTLLMFLYIYLLKKERLKISANYSK